MQIFEKVDKGIIRLIFYDDITPNVLQSTLQLFMNIFNINRDLIQVVFTIVSV